MAAMDVVGAMEVCRVNVLMPGCDGVARVSIVVNLEVVDDCGRDVRVVVE